MIRRGSARPPLRSALAASRSFAELRAGLRPSASQAAKPLELQEAEILAAVDEARRELADARQRRVAGDR
jgi:hypothetical protein